MINIAMNKTATSHKPNRWLTDFPAADFGFTAIPSEVILRLYRIDAKQTEVHLARGSSERPQ